MFEPPLHYADLLTRSLTRTRYLEHHIEDNPDPLVLRPDSGARFAVRGVRAAIRLRCWA